MCVNHRWTHLRPQIPEGLGGKNGSAVVQTVGIKSDPQCEAPYSQTFTRPGGTTTGNYTLTADFSSCKLSVFVDPTNGDFAGVQPAKPCADDPNSVDDTRAPAAFFYYLSGSANASIVLCKPKVQVFNVFVVVNATTNNLQSTDPIDTFPSTNNVSTLLQSGAYSGLVRSVVECPKGWCPDSDRIAELPSVRGSATRLSRRERWLFSPSCRPLVSSSRENGQEGRTQ